MKIQLLLPDLVALLELVDEHIDRTFPGIGPPASLRKLRTKLIHLTQTYPKVHDAPPARTRSKPGRTGRSMQKSKRSKVVRKRDSQAQTAR
jgi:hypothetical protein